MDHADFLRPTPEADYRQTVVQSLLDSSGWRRLDPVDQCRQVFLFVRDQIRHSIDARDQVVTFGASSVLECGTGLCYAKAHLVAALLRGLGVPTGYCYQKLLLGMDPRQGYCLHGFNASYLNGKWVRFDARGNRPGIDTSFSVSEEILAFQVRPELGEVDYPTIYAEPPEAISSALRSATSITGLLAQGLPASLE